MTKSYKSLYLCGSKELNYKRSLRKERFDFIKKKVVSNNFVKGLVIIVFR